MILEEKPEEDYKSRFNPKGIELLRHNGVPPNVANAYLAGISARDIISLYKIGFTPDRYNKRQTREAIPSLARFLAFLDDPNPVLDDQGNVDNYKLMGLGKSGVIVKYVNPKTGEKSAWKFGDEVVFDYIAYQILYAHHKKPLDHVINCKRLTLHRALELEYVEGMTLEERLGAAHQPLEIEETLSISLDILEGVAEMHDANMYHRDLHDRNIMLDTVNKRAVIIDLGAAGTNPEDKLGRNRAYGGNNDLVSVGQIMYRMAVGHNLFKGGAGFTQHSAVKSEISSERRKVYSKDKYLRKMLAYVKYDIEDKRMASLVADLLDQDINHQPERGKVMQAAVMMALCRRMYLDSKSD